MSRRDLPNANPAIFVANHGIGTAPQATRWNHDRVFFQPSPGVNGRMAQAGRSSQIPAIKFSGLFSHKTLPQKCSSWVFSYQRDLIKNRI